MDKNQKSHPNKKSKGDQTRKQGSEEGQETGKSGGSKGNKGNQKR